MRPFLVVGAGAVGTYVGGSLALHGYPVVWMVRSHHRARLERQGFVLHLPYGDFHLPARPLVDAWNDALEAFGPLEGVILAIKGYHLDEMLPLFQAHRDRLPPILSLLNGVDAEDLLAQAVGREKVVYGTLLTAIEREDLGIIRVTKFRGMGLEATHPVSSTWLRAFEAARLGPRGYAHPQAMKWSKLLTNLIANSLSALLDWTPDQIYRHPGLCRIEMAQIREALAVMRAWRIPVVDLPKTPVRALAWIATHLPPPAACALLRPRVARGRGSKMPSFHRDLHQGSGRTEARWYHGPVVRYGQQAGVPTPVHRALLDLWEAMEKGELSPQAFRHQPEALLKRLEAGR